MRAKRLEVNLEVAELLVSKHDVRIRTTSTTLQTLSDEHHKLDQEAANRYEETLSRLEYATADFRDRID